MSKSSLGARRALAVLSAAALVPLTAHTPAQAAVAAPTSLAPDNASVASNTPTLSWAKSSGAVKYEVQVDNDEDFSSPSFTSSTTNNKSVPTKVLPTGPINWRVRAINASSAASPWAHGSFSIEGAAAPVPVSPVGGETLAQPHEPPLLVWNGTQGATKYTVQIDDVDAGYETPLVTLETQSTSVVAPNPLPAGEYFWHVKASKASGIDTLYSDTAAFVVSSISPVTIISPNDNPDNQVEDVVLDWQPVAGATYYQLQVATDTDFNTIVDDQTKVYGTRYSPAITFDNNQYYWRVRAVDIAGHPTAWSAIQAQFNRVWPDRPEAVYPLGEGSPTHVDGDMYFEWTPVQHASQYELQVGTDANFSPGTTENCQIAGTVYTPGLYGINNTTGQVSIRTHEVCNVVPGQIYHWRVRPLDRPFTNPGVEGIYSEPQTFVYDDSAFGTLTPSGGVTVDVPTLRWSPVRGADHYEIDIKNGLGQSVKSSITTYSTSYTPVNVDALDPAKGPFTWWIRAVNADNTPASLVYQSTFNVSGTVPTTAADPLTPLSGRAGDPATLRAPELTWEPYAGADHYRVFAGPAGSGTLFPVVSGDALEKKLPYPAMTDTWTWFLSPGQYDWHVQAYADNGALLDSGPTATFTIKALTPVVGQQMALTGHELDISTGCAHKVGGTPDICTDVPSTPVFDWAPVEGAGSYILYVSEDSTFTNLLEPVTSVAGTGNTRWSPTMSSTRSAFADSQAGGAYWWFVRPCKTAKICGPNPVSTNGMATNKFRKKSPSVVPTSQQLPAEKIVTTPDVTFSWTDYFSTNQSTTWAHTGEKSVQSAQSYRVQVDNDATFASPIESVVVDQTTYTSPTRLYPEGELYWRVQAIDADSNSLSWSAGVPFTKATTKIGQTSPALEAHVNGTTAFRWAAQSSVSSYQLEVYKNNDEAASSANRLFSETGIKQSAFVWTKPVPASSAPYVWRVRRVDTSNNVGPWSTWRRFYSTGTAATLLSPAAGSLQPPNGPLFTWSAVPGAATYTIEGRSTSSTTRPWSPVTTAATAWATTQTVPTGSWEWRVTAKDSAGAVLGASAWRSFKVDATAPRVVSKSPTLTAYRTANFVAKFSEPVKSVTSSTFRIYRAGSTTPLLAKVTVSADRKTAVLNPNSNLVVGRYYTIKLTSGITDLAGNRLAATAWKVRAK